MDWKVPGFARRVAELICVSVPSRRVYWSRNSKGPLRAAPVMVSEKERLTLLKEKRVPAYQSRPTSRR